MRSKVIRVALRSEAYPIVEASLCIDRLCGDGEAGETSQGLFQRFFSRGDAKGGGEEASEVGAEELSSQPAT